MRHLLLALMIALLPIRGWVGDAMAVAMLATPAHTMAATAQADAAPCPDHAMSDVAKYDSGAEHSHSSCDVCNGPAMALSAQGSIALTPTHGLLVPPAERFVSSEPHRSAKPPIS